MNTGVLPGERRVAGMVGPGLAGSLTELLAAAALDGYAEGCAKFDATKGWDRRLFGLTVWTITAHALQGHVEELDDKRVRLLRPNGSVVLRVEGHPSTIDVGFWRQDADGDLELDPFGGSVTKDRFAAASSAEQLSLIDVERLPHLRPTVMLAAGHDGTPTDGLTAITIGQPQTGDAARWRWRERLWSPPSIGHGDPDVASPAGPAPTEGPEVTVSLKRPAMSRPAG